MRGGTSKGAVFLAADLPADPAERDELLLRVMGSPDLRQIDGLGGAHPLTSKVAVVAASTEPDYDVEYLFLQVAVDRPWVTDSQTCGNMLAAVAPFAIESGIVLAADPVTRVRVRLVNTGKGATVAVSTPKGQVTYDGATAIAGVPGTAAAIKIDIESNGGSPFPTGQVCQVLADLDATCVDMGVPCVIVRAAQLGVRGSEPPAALEANKVLTERVRAVRFAAARAMGLDDEVDKSTVPKVVLVSAPRHGGSISTRTFIPERVHQAIGALAAAGVAAAVATPGTSLDGVAVVSDSSLVRVEHPSGYAEIGLVLGADGQIRAATDVRTARLIATGFVYPAPRRNEG
jgi:4-oxalomesaconate tautomerase